MNKLVVIDDNAIEHLIIDRMLERTVSPPEVTHFYDARLSLTWLMDHCDQKDILPDIIFLDLNIPQYNGWRFLDDYKKVEFDLCKHVDIYLITSSIDIDDLKKSKLYKCVKSYVIKPLTSKFLNSLFSEQVN